MTMSEDDKKTLYKDALYWHFINQGDPEWVAKNKAERIIENP